MTPAVWVALASLAVAVIVHTIAAAYFAGKLSARVASLEGRPNDTDCKAELAAVNATLSAFKEAMERSEKAAGERFQALERTMRDLLLGKSSRSRSRVDHDEG
jgi:hypothetical protein